LFLCAFEVPSTCPTCKAEGTLVNLYHMKKDEMRNDNAYEMSNMLRSSLQSYTFLLRSYSLFNIFSPELPFKEEVIRLEKITIF
jgi:hypothetical protein